MIDGIANGLIVRNDSSHHDDLAGAPADVPALRMKNVTVRFGNRVVLDVPSLAITSGEVLAIMGPNGAGKSTLLLSLALLRKPTTGEIHIGGEMVHWGSDLLRLRRRMAVVFQEPLLLDTTVQENVAIGLRLRGQKGPGVERAVQHWLERFGIAHLARRQARTLSGGEAQRTSLARALVLAPEVLLLDEPFAALDPPTRAGVTADLQAILRETALTTVMITHDRDEALTLGDRLGVLIGGQLRQLGIAEEVFSSPVDADVAAFVGIETVVHGAILAQEEGIARVLLGDRIVEAVTVLPVGSPVLACIRPEDITLLRGVESEKVSSARNCLPGVLDRVIPLGVQVRVVVDCGFPVVALITRRSAGELGLSPGQPVYVSFKASAVHLIYR